VHDFRLTVFYTVAEKGSFSRAAKALYLTQPAVTFQVKQLEEEYGTPLFHRAPEGISLTKAGEILRRYAGEIMALYAAADREIGALTGLLRGRLVIGASTTPGEYLLPKIVGAFKRERPQVEIVMEIANTDEVVRKLVEGAFDLGVVGRPVDYPRLVQEAFGEDEIVVAVSAHSDLARKTALEAKTLRAHRLILREEGSATRQTALDALKAAGVRAEDLNIAMSLGSTEAIKAAVEADLGISLISRWALLKEARLGTVVSLRVKGADLRRQFYLIHGGKLRSPAAEQFLAFVRSFDLKELS
jgi:DNA-binding transcriptional LysR family regulator